MPQSLISRIHARNSGYCCCWQSLVKSYRNQVCFRNISLIYTFDSHADEKCWRQNGISFWRDDKLPIHSSDPGSRQCKTCEGHRSEHDEYETNSNLKSLQSSEPSENLILFRENQHQITVNDKLSIHYERARSTCSSSRCNTFAFAGCPKPVGRIDHCCLNLALLDAFFFARRTNLYALDFSSSFGFCPGK